MKYIEILKLLSSINVKILRSMEISDKKDLRYYFDRKNLYKQALFDYENNFKGLK